MKYDRKLVEPLGHRAMSLQDELNWVRERLRTRIYPITYVKRK